MDPLAQLAMLDLVVNLEKLAPVDLKDEKGLR